MESIEFSSNARKILQNKHGKQESLISIYMHTKGFILEFSKNTFAGQSIHSLFNKKKLRTHNY